MPVLADELARLHAHRWQISALSFSPDGTRLASAGWDKEVNVWDLSNLERAVNLSNVHRVPITSVSWLRPNGLHICTGSADHTAALWNAETGAYITSLRDHSGWVLDTDFSATGAFLATACWDHIVRIWDPSSEAVINSLKGHSGGVWSVKFHPNSSQFCTASEDKSVMIWDARTNRPVGTLHGQHTDAVYCATWSPDGSLIATGSADNKICVWEPKKQAVINTIYAHHDTVKSLAFNPHTENVAVPVLASAGGDRLCLSDPRPSHRADILAVSMHNEGKEVEAVAISPDGSLLVSGGRDGLIVLMTLMVPSIMPRSESNNTNLTSSVLRKSRAVRDRSYIYDVTLDEDIPRVFEDEAEEDDMMFSWQEVEEMADQFLLEPKKMEKKTSVNRMKRRSRFEEKITELPDYATVRKKGTSARNARERRARGKSYDIPTMVAHLSAAIRAYGPEEPKSSSESEEEEEKKSHRPSKPDPKVDILTHIKAWSNPENISTLTTRRTEPTDLPKALGKAKTHRQFFESELLSTHTEEEEESGGMEEEGEESGGELLEKEELENTLQTSFSPTTDTSPSLPLPLQHTQYDIGNSYRLEDLMTLNSAEENMLQWNSSSLSSAENTGFHTAKRDTEELHFTPTQQEREELEYNASDDDDVVSMI